MTRKVRNAEELYEAMRVAVAYMREHAVQNPSPAEVAGLLDMSLSRFEHAFAEWVGTTPKRFLSYLTKERARELLHDSQDLLSVTRAVGLSSPGRLHDLLVTYEAVSPGEFKQGFLKIIYGVHGSPFGLCFIAVTSRGLLRLAFLQTRSEATLHIERLQQLWKGSSFVRDDQHTQPYINKMFGFKKPSRPFHLLIRGTNFQIKVWEALLSISVGHAASYADIARRVGSPKAVRAVGTACGENPIAFLIPCHRVLTSEGGLGGYRWGTDRKEVMLAWEASRIQVLLKKK